MQDMRLQDLPRDPQIVASRLIVEQEHPRAGRFRALDTPIRFDRTPGGIRAPAPALGEHTDAVLAEAGLTPDVIAGLRKSGTIR
jgi:formyl-CoA transferase